MTGARAAEHDLALTQLTAYSTGFLPEADTLRLEEHLRGCADCRGMLAALMPAPGADPSHLPASLVATWALSTPRLAGAERALVESHLRSCEACRASLVFAGHEPVLPAAAGPVRARAARTAGAADRRAVWAWTLGLSGVGAAAAVWMLVVQPALFPRDPRTSATMGWLDRRPAGAVTFELSQPATAPGAIALPEPGGGEAPAVELGLQDPGAGWVLLLPDALTRATPADGGRDVSLALSRQGRVWGARHCRLDALGGALRLRPAVSLPAGDYELHVTVAARGASEPARVWVFPLRVR